MCGFTPPLTRGKAASSCRWSGSIVLSTPKIHDWVSSGPAQSPSWFCSQARLADSPRFAVPWRLAPLADQLFHAEQTRDHEDEVAFTMRELIDIFAPTNMPRLSPVIQQETLREGPVVGRGVAVRDPVEFRVALYFLGFDALVMLAVCRHLSRW